VRQIVRGKRATAKRLRIVTLGFGAGRQRWSLNDGQIPNFRGERVHVTYNRGEETRIVAELVSFPIRNLRQSVAPRTREMPQHRAVARRWAMFTVAMFTVAMLRLTPVTAQLAPRADAMQRAGGATARLSLRKLLQDVTASEAQVRGRGLGSALFVRTGHPPGNPRLVRRPRIAAATWTRTRRVDRMC
jgi:hypothetical protein